MKIGLMCAQREHDTPRKSARQIVEPVDSFAVFERGGWICRSVASNLHSV